ncbi:MAG: 2-oxo acid dehydrogenase subunit E2, partial [Candidatus Thorarchaeota archaeon]
MATVMIMQRMSVAMEYGVILKWLKKEGDKVKKGDPIVEIFGEKNEFELESPADGILLKTLCDVNDEIPISEPIAIIGKKGDKLPDVTPKKWIEGASAVPTGAAAAPVATAKTQTAVTGEKRAVTLPSGKIRASPRARKAAKEQGIDLSMVVGSGPDGRIVEKDVADYRQAPMVVENERKIGQVEPLSPLRRTIARRMTQSSHNPHITMITEIDMTEAVGLRTDINKRNEKKLGFRVSFNDIIVKAVADILERFPKFNATLSGN